MIGTKAHESFGLKRLILLIVIYLAFVSLGLPDGVLGLAWPGMRASLGQPLEALGLVTFVLAGCSAISGFMSGRVLARFGTGPVTFVSALMTGLSLLGLSQVPNFPLMVALAFPLGLGAGSVDAGLNHFVADHYSAGQGDVLVVLFAGEDDGQIRRLHGFREAACRPMNTGISNTYAGRANKHGLLQSRCLRIAY